MKAITKRTIFLEQINARKGRNNWIELLFHETFIIVKMLLEKWCNSYLLWKPWLLPRQKCAARKLERRQGLSPFLLVHPKAALPTSWIFVEASFRLPPMLPINTHQTTTLPSYALLQKAQFFFSFFFFNINHTAVIKATAFSAAQHHHCFLLPFVSQYYHCKISSSNEVQLSSRSTVIQIRNNDAAGS